MNHPNRSQYILRAGEMRPFSRKVVFDVVPSDVPEILDRLLDGARVVERLLIERSPG
ncbi:MAG: hypothetical protein AB1486_10935 [Planctomycetota bacterium]